MTSKETKRPRKFQNEQPWLTFTADFRFFPYELWMNLGAIQSKCDHIANAMLPPDVMARLDQIYLAKGVQASTAIEGNSLTEKEVLERVQGKQSTPIPKSKEYQVREVDNVIRAYREIQNEIFDSQKSVTSLTTTKICEWNRIVLHGLDFDDDIRPGEISQHRVVVGNYRGSPREDCRYLLDRLCQWMNSEFVAPSPDQEIAFGVLRAIYAHLYLAWIHPFGDGNGRTARLLEIYLLLSAGVPSIAANLLSNHYNYTRPEYYRQLDRASKKGPQGDPVGFVKYAVQGFVDQLVLAIREIDSHQYEVAWRDFVYEKFRNKTGQAIERQRRVALDLYFHHGGVTASQILTLTPELARYYAPRSERTLFRDLDILEEMKLLWRAEGTIYPYTEQLTFFLPKRRESPPS